MAVVPPAAEPPRLVRGAAFRLPRARWVRVVLALAAGVGLYALIGFQLVPWLVREQAIAQVRAHYGRVLALEAVRFHPFALRLELDRLRLPDAEDGEVLAFESLRVDFEAWRSLWQRAWVFRAITIDGLALKAELRRDGTLNLADFAGAEPASDHEAGPPALIIDALRLHDGALTFRDRSGARPFAQTLTPISFELRNFRTRQDGGVFSLSARGEQGARFWWQGSIALAPQLASQGRMAIANVALPGLTDYVAAASPLALQAGTGSFSLSYQVQLGGALRAEVVLHDALLQELSLAARAAPEHVITVPSLRVKSAKLTWPARAIEVAAVRVSDLRMGVERDTQGQLNWLRVLAGGESADASTPPWQFALARFDLEHASATVADGSVEPPLRAQVHALDLHARELGSDLTRPVPFELRANLGSDGSMSATGSATPASVEAELQVSLANLRLALAQPYLQTYAALAVDDGRVFLDGRLVRKQADAAWVHSFAGTLTLRELRTRDLAGQEFVNVGELALRGLHYRDQPASLEIAQVALQRPFARVVLNRDQTLNVRAILHGGRAGTSAPTSTQATASKLAAPRAGEATASKLAAPRAGDESTASSLAVDVGEVAVNDLRLHFSDYFIQPNFALDLRGVRGTVKGLSSDPAARAVIALRGTLGSSAPVQIRGQLTPFAYDAASDIELSWQNVPLPVFNPYSGRFAGYSIEKGDLASTVRYRLRRGKLDAQHHVRVDQLTWGAASETKESATLPVRLATALLRDRNGVITLDVPVQGALDDPTFEVWPLVKQALINVATRAVTAPFDFLGSLFQGAEKARYVDFRPGESALDPSDRDELRALSAALAERPSLVLEVPLGVDRALDREALIDRKYQRALAATIERELWGARKHAPYAALDDEDREDVLEALFERLTGKEPQLPDPPPAPEGAGFRARRQLRRQFAVRTLERMTRDTIQIDQGELDALGLGRANSIERALTEDGKIERHRVLVSSAGKVHSERGAVRFELALE